MFIYTALIFVNQIFRDNYISKQNIKKVDYEVQRLL
jgi:hypothetical protein